MVGKGHIVYILSFLLRKKYSRFSICSILSNRNWSCFEISGFCLSSTYLEYSVRNILWLYFVRCAATCDHFNRRASTSKCKNGECGDSRIGKQLNTNSMTLRLRRPFGSKYLPMQMRIYAHKMLPSPLLWVNWRPDMMPWRFETNNWLMRFALWMAASHPWTDVRPLWLRKWESLHLAIKRRAVDMTRANSGDDINNVVTIENISTTSHRENGLGSASWKWIVGNNGQ